MWNTRKQNIETGTCLLLVSPRTLHILLKEFLLTCKSVKCNLDPSILLRCEIHTWCVLAWYELWCFLPQRSPANRLQQRRRHLVVSTLSCNRYVFTNTLKWPVFGDGHTVVEDSRNVVIFVKDYVASRPGRWKPL